MFGYRHPLLLLYAFPFVSLVDVFFPFLPLRLGGFSLLPLDPLYFLMVAYIGISALRTPRRVMGIFKRNVFLTMFLGMLATSALIFLPVYGQSAVGEARKFYFFFIFPIFASLVIEKPADLRRFLQAVIFAAGFVGVLCFGIAAFRGSVVRAGNSEATLIVGLAAFAMLIQRMHRLNVIHPIADRILLCLFGMLALASGQRSVWLAIGFGALLLFWLYHRSSALMVRTAVITVAAVLLSITALLSFPEFGERLANKFAGIVNPYADNTASWRIQGWQAHLNTVKENLLFGEGLGSYYSWKLRGKFEVNVSPHNAYIQLMLKFGLVGLIIYAFLAIHFFRKMLAFRKKTSPGLMRAYAEIGIVCFGASHAYMVGYGIEPIVLIYFALATSALKLTEEKFQMSPTFQSQSFQEDLRMACNNFSQPQYHRPSARNT
jgi:O-antigen ligase